MQMSEPHQESFIPDSKRKYLAFDIETSKVLPDGCDDIHMHRPLGITCAAIKFGDSGEVLKYCFNEVLCDGEELAYFGQSRAMRRHEVAFIVKALTVHVSRGYTIVTHNGLGFDFDILAEESGLHDECRFLALKHVDMMFHFFCIKGFAIGLDSAARVIGLGKPKDIDGSIAPQLWANGEYRKVLDYVASDCNITLAVAMECELQSGISWISKKGRTMKCKMPDGLLTVEDAMKLPEPDNSWLDEPWTRSKFSSWLSGDSNV